VRPHFIPGELLSVTDHDVLHEDVMKGHVDRMNHREQLDDLLPQIRDNHVSDQGNVTQTSGIMVARIPVLAFQMR
jgi:hypothetical protein